MGKGRKFSKEVGHGLDGQFRHGSDYCAGAGGDDGDSLGRGHDVVLIPG